MSATTDLSSGLRVTDRVPRRVALAFLRAEVRDNVYLLSRVNALGESPRAEDGVFLGAFDGDGSLRGFASLSATGTFVMSVDEPSVAAAFAPVLEDRGLRFSICVAEWDAGKAFLDAWRAVGGAEPALNRKQFYRVLTPRTLAKGVDEIDMEQASIDSIDELTDLSIEMVSEDLRIDPGSIDRRRYRMRIAASVAQGRSFVCRDEEGRPIFKCDLAVLGPEGAVLEGVYTPRDLRRRGIATRAVHTLCSDLLGSEGVPFVALHFDARNIGARRVYEAVGFEPHMDVRLMVMPPVPLPKR